MSLKAPQNLRLITPCDHALYKKVLISSEIAQINLNIPAPRVLHQLRRRKTKQPSATVAALLLLLLVLFSHAHHYQRPVRCRPGCARSDGCYTAAASLSLTLSTLARLMYIMLPPGCVKGSPRTSISRASRARAVSSQLWTTTASVVWYIYRPTL